MAEVASRLMCDEADPDFEAPPVFAVRRERRMPARAHQEWTARLNGREFPAPRDFCPEELADFAPNAVLLDFAANPGRPMLRYIGERLRNECDLSGEPVAAREVPPRSLLSRLSEHYGEILASRAPVGFEAEFVGSRGNETLYRGILLPLSSNGRDIDMVLGVMNWKELLARDLEAALHAEAGLI